MSICQEERHKSIKMGGGEDALRSFFSMSNIKNLKVFAYRIKADGGCGRDGSLWSDFIAGVSPPHLGTSIKRRRHCSRNVSHFQSSCNSFMERI